MEEALSRSRTAPRSPARTHSTKNQKRSAEETASGSSALAQLQVHALQLLAKQDAFDLKVARDVEAVLRARVDALVVECAVLHDRVAELSVTKPTSPAPSPVATKSTHDSLAADALREELADERMAHAATRKRCDIMQARVLELQAALAAASTSRGGAAAHPAQQEAPSESQSVRRRSQKEANMSKEHEQTEAMKEEEKTEAEDDGETRALSIAQRVPEAEQLRPSSTLALLPETSEANSVVAVPDPEAPCESVSEQQLQTVEPSAAAANEQPQSEAMEVPAAAKDGSDTGAKSSRESKKKEKKGAKKTNAKETKEEVATETAEEEDAHKSKSKSKKKSSKRRPREAEASLAPEAEPQLPKVPVPSESRLSNLGLGDLDALEAAPAAAERAPKKRRKATKKPDAAPVAEQAGDVDKPEAVVEAPEPAALPAQAAPANSKSKAPKISKASARKKEAVAAMDSLETALAQLDAVEHKTHSLRESATRKRASDENAVQVHSDGDPKRHKKAHAPQHPLQEQPAVAEEQQQQVPVVAQLPKAVPAEVAPPPIPATKRLFNPRKPLTFDMPAAAGLVAGGGAPFAMKKTGGVGASLFSRFFKSAGAKIQIPKLSSAAAATAV